MNTGLGLSFWRIVNEEGSNGWAQIYAHIPFDDVELKTKGALFGVIFGEDKENWADRDAELMAWVEEYFNSLETSGELADFGNLWKEKYPNLVGVWVWVNTVGGKRELRIAKWGNAGVVLTRNEKEFDFAKNLVEGKVMKGKIEQGDRLAIFTEGVKQITKELSNSVEEDISKWNEELKERGNAAAGLIFDFGKLAEEVEEDMVEEVVEMREESGEKEVETPVRQESRSQERSLAENRFVGPIGMKEKMANWWMKLRPIESKGVVERKVNVKRKKWAMLLGVLFLGLLVVSLVTGSIKMKKQSEMKKWQSFSEPIEKNLQEAVNLSAINSIGAKKIIEDVRVQFDTGKGEFINSKYKDALASLEKKIGDTWTSVSGEKESQIEEILRIDLVRQGFKGDRLGLIKDGQFFALDKQMGVIVTAEEKTKDIKVVAGKGEGLGWLDVAGDTSKVLVLSNTGIRNAVNGEDLIKFDAAVARPIALGKFGANLYVLDQGNKEIYRYAAIESGYSDRVRWLKQDQSMSITPVDMAIDSDIWVVSETGQVERFRRGSKENFAVSGLVAGMKVVRIAAESEGKRIAMMDNISGLVVICEKETGNCNQTLKSGRLIGAGDIEFDTQGNLLVLTQGVVGIMR